MNRLVIAAAVAALSASSCLVHDYRRAVDAQYADEYRPPKAPTGLYRDPFQPLIVRSQQRIAADAGCPITATRTSPRTWILKACALRLSCWAHDDLSWDCAAPASDQL